jgi:hypothetical protein
MRRRADRKPIEWIIAALMLAWLTLEPVRGLDVDQV